MRQETSLCNCRELRVSRIFLAYLMSRKTLSCRIISHGALHQRGVHKALRASARWRSYCRSSPHKRETHKTCWLHVLISVLFDAASLIIGIGPRSTQRTLGSHRETFRHYLLIQCIHTSSSSMVSVIISALSSKDDGEKLEKTFQIRASAMNKGERKEEKPYVACVYMSVYTCECIFIRLHVCVCVSI